MASSTGSWFPKVFQSSQQPLRFPAGGDSVPHHEAIEEELLPSYKASRYLSVKVGDVYHTRYQVVGKLGYGVTSTVWLAKDLKEHRHVALKIYINESLQASGAATELSLSSRLHHSPSKSSNPHNIRIALDHFDIRNHAVLVYEPMAMSVSDMLDELFEGQLPADIVRIEMRALLEALDYLHTKADLIHTDIKASNILLTSRDPSVFKAVEDAALAEAPPHKVLPDGRHIYHSYSVPAPDPEKWGEAILADFGEAQNGPQKFTRARQPRAYRAPEMMLEMDWDHKIDLWNLGCLAWHLLEGRLPFAGDDDAHHLAEVVGLLGPPPPKWVQRSPIASRFFDKDGQWTSKRVPEASLESRCKSLSGKEKTQFLAFIRTLLAWDPSRRPSAAEVLRTDPWLNG